MLCAGKVGAAYIGRMEFGPRALGARSILANPADPRLNLELNRRLERSDFMPIARDLALVVDKDVRAGDIVEAARSAAGSLVSNVGVFDVYLGAGLPEGAKSVGINVTLQPRERTLTDAEIDAAVANIVAEVVKKTGATLRG